MEKSTSWKVPASIVVAGIVIALAIIYTPGKSSAPKDNNDTVGENTETGRVLPTIDDDAILGSADAPVTWIEFGDYECPFCAKLFETEKQLKEKYLASGQVRFVYRDFPLDFHPTAVPSAEAAECAGDQGAYWQYHDALFERQQTIIAGDFDYTALASELGLDAAAFGSCVENRAHKEEVEADMAAGVAAGVQGTPGVFINGTFVEGAYPFETFDQVIQEALQK
ncbi:MAG: DsbA family protein [Candidatus Harrisonbacteria bacterium]|nr:DsbA family protein [Candidatus Harrisonbacteria bacterium]